MAKLNRQDGNQCPHNSIYSYYLGNIIHIHTIIHRDPTNEMCIPELTAWGSAISLGTHTKGKHRVNTVISQPYQYTNYTKPTLLNKYFLTLRTRYNLVHFELRTNTAKQSTAIDRREQNVDELTRIPLRKSPRLSHMWHIERPARREKEGLL